MSSSGRPAHPLLIAADTRVTCPRCTHEFSLDEGFARRALESLEQGSDAALAELMTAERSREQRRLEAQITERDRGHEQQLAQLRQQLTEQAAREQHAHRQALASERERAVEESRQEREALERRLSEQATQVQALRPEPSGLKSDLIAGLTFAIVNIPQAMGHALLATVNPVFGIYTLMVAVPVGAIFTGSVFMNVSTTAALSVAAGSGLARSLSLEFAGYDKHITLFAIDLAGDPTDRLAETEAHQLPDRRLVGAVVDLVGDHQHRTLEPSEQLGDPGVLLRHAHRRVEHEEDDVGRGDGLLRLAAHLLVQVGATGHPPPGVHDEEGAPAPVGFDHLPVARDAGPLLDDRLPAADDPVDERRLAHVRPADDRKAQRTLHRMSSSLAA